MCTSAECVRRHFGETNLERAPPIIFNLGPILPPDEMLRNAHQSRPWILDSTPAVSNYLSYVWISEIYTIPDAFTTLIYYTIIVANGGII